MMAKPLFRILPLILVLVLNGCGGGGSSTAPPSPAPPSFTISVNPSSFSMSPGTSTTVNVSLQAQNGFDGTASVAISGLPDGLTVVPPSPFSLTAAGQHIYLITNKGLTIAQLDSVPLSVGSVTPHSGAAGTQVKIRGSGFVAGTTATANGTSAAVSFVDADTLQVVLPMLPSGAVQITLTNPDGQTYSLGDSFTVQ